jgi:hypothetical protein
VTKKVPISIFINFNFNLFLIFIPLQAEQGGINFTPFVLCLQNAKKKKKKKIHIWMGVSSEMSVSQWDKI